MMQRGSGKLARARHQIPRGGQTHPENDVGLGGAAQDHTNEVESGRAAGGIIAARCPDANHLKTYRSKNCAGC